MCIDYRLGNYLTEMLESQDVSKLISNVIVHHSAFGLHAAELSAMVGGGKSAELPRPAKYAGMWRREYHARKLTVYACRHERLDKCIKAPIYVDKNIFRVCNSVID